MPTYDVRCRACGSSFEVNRPMAQADDPAPCPQGHHDTVRLLPTVGLSGRAGSSSHARVRAGDSAPPGSSGGCCGGGCGCG